MWFWRFDDYVLISGKCYACTGSQTNCGNDISGIGNSTDKVKIIDCGIGDCWAHRLQSGSSVTFTRGCSNETCSASYENENCKTVEGKKECKKCCRGEKCNTWALDGNAGVEGLAMTFLSIVLCTIVSIIWK